jgi:hypothetical protein
MKTNCREQGGMSAAVKRNTCGAFAKHACFGLMGLTMFVVWATLPLQAKVDAGISGIVTDASGAVISGAAVQVKALETGLIQKRQTNSDGFYAFIDLPPGHYEIEVSLSGFNTFRQPSVLLDVNSAKVLNVKLNVGQVNE